MARTNRHNIFISYHDEDREYKERFVSMMKGRLIDKSVKVDDIDDTNLKVETIRQKIRDDFIRDATVTIVLIGPCTWQRKHVDWEIGSSLRKTKKNSRCGLLGILLPNHPNYNFKRNRPNFRLLPPRLVDNISEKDPYARIYKWPRPWAPARIQQWIHEAYDRRYGTPPNNGRTQFSRNRSGSCSRGWQG